MERNGQNETTQFLLRYAMLYEVSFYRCFNYIAKNTNEAVKCYNFTQFSVSCTLKAVLLRSVNLGVLAGQLEPVAD